LGNSQQPKFKKNVFIKRKNETDFVQRNLFLLIIGRDESGKAIFNETLLSM